MDDPAPHLTLAEGPHPFAPRERAHFFRHPALPDSDLLTAHFIEHRFTPHWHDFYAIPVIETGAEAFQYGGKHLVVSPGRMGVVNPGEVHTGEAVSAEGWRYRVFYPTVPVMQQVADELAGRPAPLPWFPVKVVEDAPLCSVLGAAHRVLEQGNDPLQAESLLVNGLSLLLQRHAGTRSDRALHFRDDARVQQMLLRLADDPAQDLNLQMLADQVGLSRYHAVRLFSQTVGMPPHAWRVQLRVNRAAAALRRGIPVAQVALDAGFTDQSHFTRHFKRAFGVAPGRWQQARRAA